MRALMIAAVVLLSGCDVQVRDVEYEFSLAYDKTAGVRIYTDASTGCEYISIGSGSLTPRIDSDYMHKGCRGVEGQ